MRMVEGYVKNNTGRSRHIFKKTVYPGQIVSLGHIKELLGSKVPEGASFIAWLEQYLPEGWEISVPKRTRDTGGRQYKEVLTAVPTVVENSEEASEHIDEEEDDSPSKEYATPRAIDKMTSRDIYNLRLKDNPKRVLKHVNSIHKLRRALTMCKNDSRKSVLQRLIQQRIRELNLTL